MFPGDATHTDSQRASLCTVIGDVVGSRKAPRQRELLAELRDAIEWVNAEVPSPLPLRPSVGDEIQGAYHGVVDALRASLLVRLRLLGSMEVRWGFGWGEVDLSKADQAPIGQSGSGWWRAREAIERAARRPRSRRWPASACSSMVSGQPEIDAWIDALLICRDEVFAGLDATDARITLALFAGESQVALSGQLGLAQSTISARQKRRGASALYQAQNALESAVELLA